MIPDKQIKDRYNQFWNRSNTSRACLYLTSWDGSPGFRKPSDLEEKWLSPEYNEEMAVYNAGHTRYYAEGFSSEFINFGPGSLAACIGGSFRIAPNTVWYDNAPHFIEDPENYIYPELDTDSEMYRLTEQFTSRHLSHKDLYVTSVPDIGGEFDVVASLRGTENLLYDLYDHPWEVLELGSRVEKLWEENCLYLANRLLRSQGGMTSWMPIYSDRIYYPLQCDFCAMISPGMFRKFILPGLTRQTEILDRSVYHLDGPSELPHLDMILSMPRLNAVQWTSGDGNPGIDDPVWYDLYRKIQNAGKGLVLLGFPMDGLENLLKNISSRGLFLSSGVRDGKEAEEIIVTAERLAV